MIVWKGEVSLRGRAGWRRRRRVWYAIWLQQRSLQKSRLARTDGFFELLLHIVYKFVVKSVIRQCCDKGSGCTVGGTFVVDSASLNVVGLHRYRAMI